MITYLGMSAPIAAAPVVSWARHPAQEGAREVQVNRLPHWEYPALAAAALAVTGVFYFILKACGTQELGLSTLSVFTSFTAAYLTMRRSPLFALAYAANEFGFDRFVEHSCQRGERLSFDGNLLYGVSG